jgi:hypothetical protein
MAKKEQKNPDHYEYIRATIEDGQLRWRYRLNNANVEGSDTHDEDVSSWTDREIIELTKTVMTIESDDPVKIEIVWGG